MFQQPSIQGQSERFARYQRKPDEMLPGELDEQFRRLRRRERQTRRFVGGFSECGVPEI